MSSINLSFREWPFLSLNLVQGNSQLKSSSYSTLENDILKKNVPSYLIPKGSCMGLSTNIDDNISTENSGSIKKLENYHLTSWGRCGLFACTNESCLSIFSNDERGNLTPMFMFSPFDVLSIGKINKQPQTTSLITGIAWSDGHLEPSYPKSILAASSNKGHLVVYDFETKDRIGCFHFDDVIVSILWCSFKQNRFYCGSKNGHFYICELTDHKTIEILKTFDFVSKPANSFETVYKSIDYITQDDVNGHTVGIASKEQPIGFITDINDPEKMDLQIFQNFKINEKDDDIDDKITFFEFYPNSNDFVTISSNSSSFFLSISKGIMIPFIQSTDCKFISFCDNENDKVIIGNENEINIWKLNDQFWSRLFNLNIGNEEILTFSKIDDNKILLTTSSNWLTEVEYKRNKIFVTKRIKLIDGRIVDYDFGDGSIAFLTSNNTIALTEPTPESIIEPIFSEKHEKNEKSSDESTQQYSSSNDDDESTLINNLREENTDLRRSKSYDYDSDTSSSKYQIDESQCGNSNSLFLAFKIDNEVFGLKYIKWISPYKIVVWCKFSLYLIDLKNRSITEPLAKKFCKKTVRITNVFFSKSRKIMGIIIDHIKAYFINTDSDLSIIKSFDFGDKNINDKDYLLGSISPNEDKAVFSLSNSLYFINLNEKELPMKEVKSFIEFQGSFLSWENQGIFIGTEMGGALLIPNDKIKEIIDKAKFGKRYVKIIFNSLNSDKLKLEAIKHIFSCSNQTYVIIDSSHKGIIVSQNVKMIAENIKSIKQASDDYFLVSFQNYNRLAVINSYNEIKSALPPCFYLSHKKKNNFMEEIKNIESNNINDSDLVNSISNQIFQTSETNFSTSLQNSVKLLNDIISCHDHFNSVSSKAFLELGDLEEAKNMFLKSNPKEKDYLNNMVLVAIYKSNPETVQLIEKNFLSNNLIDEAVNVLLMTKNIFLAADILAKKGRNEDAYRILMLNDQRKECDNAEKIILSIADSLITNKENILFGLKLLSSFGYFQEMIKYISINI